METRSAKKRKLLLLNLYSQNHRTKDENNLTRTTTTTTTSIANSNNNNNADRISDLPDAVLHRILFLLPIKSVAQTAVLSKRWRSIWSSFPDLDFTTLNPSAKLLSSPSPTKSPSPPHPKEPDIITRVLVLRDKSSDIRTLRLRSRISFSRLNNLIRLAVRRQVHELDVEVATEDYFNFPRCVVASDTLRVFKLTSRYPGFRLPPTSVMTSGFRSLHSLSLSLVVLHNQPSLSEMFSDTSFPSLKKLSLDKCSGLKHLRVGCRVLEDFTLENCFQLQGLDVSGAKLERLKIASCFNSYIEKSWVKIDAPRLKIVVWENNAITDNCCLENVSCVDDASISLFLMDGDISSVAKLQSVSNLFVGLSHAHCLRLESICVEVYILQLFL